MTAEDIGNQAKRYAQYESERRKQFIARMERKLIFKQRRTSYRYIPRNWFPVGFSINGNKYEDELPPDIFKSLH